MFVIHAVRVELCLVEFRPDLAETALQLLLGGEEFGDGFTQFAASNEVIEQGQHAETGEGDDDVA